MFLYLIWPSLTDVVGADIFGKGSESNQTSPISYNDRHLTSLILCFVQFLVSLSPLASSCGRHLSAFPSLFAYLFLLYFCLVISASPLSWAFFPAPLHLACSHCRHVFNISWPFHLSLTLVSLQSLLSVLRLATLSVLSTAFGGSSSFRSGQCKVFAWSSFQNLF